MLQECPHKMDLTCVCVSKWHAHSTRTATTKAEQHAGGKQQTTHLEGLEDEAQSNLFIA
jgi:hypothetical protein